MENLGKKSGAMDITNRIQEIPQKILTEQFKKCKMQKHPNQKHPGISGHMKRPSLRIIGIQENKDSQFRWPKNIFSKTREENFPN